MSLALTAKYARLCGAKYSAFGKQRWPVLLLCVFLAGCSATRLVYNRIDWILVWYISDYFTLEDEQEDLLKESVERNMEWHRRDQLPKYVQLLREIEQDFSSGAVTIDMMERFYAQFIILWDEFLVQTMPDVTAFFMTLSQEQIDEFIDNLEESNQELWEEYAGKMPEERRKSRQDGAIKGFERAFGRLSDEQKELIRSYQSTLHDVSHEWMVGRRQWQQDFRNLVVARPPEPEFSDRMLELMLEPNRNDTPEYRQLIDENRLIMMTLTMALSAELTDKQRNKFSKRLNKLNRNFEILAAQKT
jgi:hypothetical protein